MNVKNRKRFDRIVEWTIYVLAIAAFAWAVSGCSIFEGNVNKLGAAGSVAAGTATGAVLVTPAGLLTAIAVGISVAFLGLWLSAVTPTAPLPIPLPWYTQVLDAVLGILWIVVLLAALLVAWRRGWLAAGFRRLKAYLAPTPPPETP